MTGIAYFAALALAFRAGPMPAIHGSLPQGQTGAHPQEADAPRQDADQDVGELISRGWDALSRGEHHESRQLAALALDAAVEQEAGLPREQAADAFWEVGLLGDEAEAILCAHEALERAYALRAQRLPEDHPDVCSARSALARSRAELGDLSGARDLGQSALAVLERSLDEADFELADARRSLALTLLESGDREQARALLERAVAGLEAGRSGAAPELSALRLELAIALELLGERDRACASFGRALSDSKTWLVAESEPRALESGPGWQWALMELVMKLDFLTESDGLTESDREVLFEHLFAIAEEPNPAESLHLTGLHADLIEVLRKSPPGAETRPSVFITLADAYAGRLQGHCPGWLDVLHGGRAARTLHRAAELGQLEAVELLLENGVDPGVQCFDVVHWEPGEPYLLTRSALPLAASEGRVEVMRVLMAAGVAPDDAKPGGLTALAFAAREEGAAEVVRLLLDAGASPLVRDKKGWLPLTWAAFSGDYGTFVALLDASRSTGMSPEEERAVAERLEHRNSDLRHPMMQALSRAETTPLHIAARRGPTDELARLLESGADPDVTAQDGGWRALHWAAGYEGDPERTRLLLEAGADPNAATAGGYTPLIAAAQAACLERVQLLLDAGADPNAVDEDNRTALHVAAWRASPEVLRALLERGADPTIRNRWTQTPRDLAERRKENGGAEVVHVFDEQESAWWPSTTEEIQLLEADTSGIAAPTLRITETSIQRAGGKRTIELTLWLYSTEAALAFDVLRVEADRETSVGTLVADGGAVRAWTYEIPAEDDVPREVEILLRPSCQLALEELQTWSIWGEPVTIRGRIK